MAPPMSPVCTVEQSLDRIAEESPRFRILIVGRVRLAAISITCSVHRRSITVWNGEIVSDQCKTSLADVQHDRAGSANIDEGIASPHNKHLILHDSQGYEPGDIGKFGILERFITERSQKEPIAERLHAIWLCITAPFSRGRIFETREEKIFKLNRNKVPIIVVFTKFDLFIACLSRRNRGKENISMDLAEKKFRDEHGVAFEKATQNISGKIPYTTVAISMPNTLHWLVEITMQSIAESPGPSRSTRKTLQRLVTMNRETPISSLTRIKSLFGRSTWPTRADGASSAQIALALAQRVDIATWIAASINVNIREYLFAIHKDIVMFWNMDELFLSDAFCHKMMVIVDDLIQQNSSVMQRKGVLTTVAARLSVYQRRLEYTRCLMGYVVDLTLILQAVAQLFSPSRVWFTEKAQDRVNEIIYVFSPIWKA
ncbi:hypothetical protein F5887DRAFT_1287007 [Amanita rubescens]|nr:hypothetical protein F5887DRAFT_1287007 [Amanita rubescens]